MCPSPRSDHRVVVVTSRWCSFVIHTSSMCPSPRSNHRVVVVTSRWCSFVIHNSSNCPSTRPHIMAHARAPGRLGSTSSFALDAHDESATERVRACAPSRAFAFVDAPCATSSAVVACAIGTETFAAATRDARGVRAFAFARARSSANARGRKLAVVGRAMTFACDFATAACDAFDIASDRRGEVDVAFASDDGAVRAYRAFDVASDRAPTIAVLRDGATERGKDGSGERASNVRAIRAMPRAGDAACAYAAADGGVYVARVGNVVDVVRAPVGEGESAFYGLARHPHPKCVIHASAREVALVDARARAAEVRELHASGADGNFVAMSRDAIEHYYALAIERGARARAHVEIRDARRASEPVVRWEHRGIEAPTTVTLDDTSAWRRRRTTLGVRAFSSSRNEVFLYECAREDKGRNGYSSGGGARALSPGVVTTFGSTPLRGFDAVNTEEFDALVWMNARGVYCQTYERSVEEEGEVRLRPLFYESPALAEHDAAERVDVDEAAANITSTAARAKHEFVSVPFVYNYVVNGRVPMAVDAKNESKNESSGNDAVAYLHSKLSDGWRMNSSELLDSAELLSSPPVPSLQLSEWRASRRIAARKSLTAKQGWSRRVKERVPNPLDNLAKNDDVRAWASELEPPPRVLDAIIDYASGNADNHPYVRRLYHAARCIESVDHSTVDVGGASTMHPKARATTTKRVRDRASIPVDSDFEDERNTVDVGQGSSFIASLRADWAPPSRA